MWLYLCGSSLFFVYEVHKVLVNDNNNSFC